MQFTKSKPGSEKPTTLIRKILMYACHRELISYQRKQVMLPQFNQVNLCEKQKAIWRILLDILNKDGRPVPYMHRFQGSFQMNTMINDSKNKSDLDDGIYFLKDELVDEHLNEMNSEETKQMVCNALSFGTSNFKPVVQGKCVRIQYNDDTQIDLPIFRRIEKNHKILYEFASESNWELSNAIAVNRWYERVRMNSRDSRQFLRLTRYLKKLAKAHKSSKEEILSGFGITVLLEEVAKLHPNRDDSALFQTMCSIERRLSSSTVILNPMENGSKVVSDENSSDAINFKDRIADAIDRLSPLNNPRCKRKTALECWDKVFNTKFFSEYGNRKINTLQT